ncbi:hypothetical protein EJ04DRAFT_465045 [Polyplosphaeria fusca]|uniref:Uncharacterized protein n=1 Tax=Polyplosphaeria fusca TaxID=682080 RepID=A0A9P4R1X5_9PLEO|nr:hypothetical protein EJ04DRAFT_465045 [Polyplosphaeria fusca]
MGYIDHVVRRGLEHPSTVSLLKRAIQDGPEQIEIPKWGVAVLVVTFLCFFVSLSSLEYTLRDVVATLAMVETPSAAITVSPSEESAPKDVKEGLLETGPTITLVHQKPITSSIRGTIRHLLSVAGWTSRWRGLLSFIFYYLCFAVTTNIFDSLIPRFVPGRVVLIAAISGALLANVHAAWTHKVIAVPAEKRFQLFKRIPARSTWKHLALPAAINAAAVYVSVYIAQGWMVLLRLDRVGHENLEKYTCAQWTSLAVRAVSVIVIGFALAIFIIVPARVTQIRVEASILPEEVDTIVPFDRTFDGKVVPKILGGTGCVAFLDAWRSFNWEARRRLIKLYVKMYAIVTAFTIVFAILFAFNVWAVAGAEVNKQLARARNQGF